jgi:hypothetical protein
MLPESRVLGRDDGRDEGGGDLRERDRPAVDRIALPFGAEPLLSRADEGGRRRVAPPQKDDLRKRDEDEGGIQEEKEGEEKKRFS